MFFGSLSLAIRDPKIVFGTPEDISESLWKTRGRRLLVVCFLVLNPVFLISRYETMQDSLAGLAGQKLTDESIVEIYAKMKQLRRIEKEFTSFVRLELGTETFYQITGSVVLLLLAQTQTPTVSGLDTMFEKNEFFGIPSIHLLVISILISSNTCILVYLKATAVEKPHFPFKAKFCLFLFAIIGTLQSICVKIAFFVPFLGQLSILSHWKAEQTLWADKKVIYLENGVYTSRPLNYTTDTLYLTNNVSVAWTEVNRADYSDPARPVPPPYTLYTGLSLQPAFALFCLIHSLHLLSIITIKWLTVQNLFKVRPNISCPYHSKANVEHP